MTHPTILLVPGAWHYPDGFGPLIGRLKAFGYDTKTVSLVSVSATPPPLTDHSADTEAVRAVLKPLVDSGKDVVIFAHSYGSIPVSDALEGLPRSGTNGVRGGISHVVHANSFVCQENESCVDINIATGSNPDWFSVSEDGMTASVNPGRGVDIFYSDLDPEVAKEHESKLGASSAQTFFSKQKYASWKDFPSTYISCSEDRCTEQYKQKFITERCPGMHVVELKGGHSPYLSQVETVAEIVRRAAGEDV